MNYLQLEIITPLVGYISINKLNCVVRKMTGQDPEILIDNGKKKMMMINPLEKLFEGHRNRPPFQMQRTSRRRGYVATWEIKDGKVYILSIDGIFKNQEPITIQKIFPGKTPPVFVRWFSGELRVGSGKVVRPGHMGYDEIYQREEKIVIKDGRVIERIITRDSKKYKEKR